MLHAVRYGIIQPGFREFEKSLFVWESRSSLSVLLGRERRFSRWMLGNGVVSPSARPEAFDQSYGSTNYNFQQNVRIIKIR